MKTTRFVMGVLLSGIVLLGTGCGGGDKADGQLVTPTEEVRQSRSAVEDAVRKQPNMYGPPKGAQSKRQ